MHRGCMGLKSTDAATRGALIAGVLAGAWRSEPLPLNLSPDEWSAITPILMKSGSGALVWWRLQRSPCRRPPEGQDFQQAYRRHAIDAEIHRRRAMDVLARLSTAGVEALLVKGWSIARLYPERGLRQYADLDVIVRPGQMEAARACLA